MKALRGALVWSDFSRTWVESKTEDLSDLNKVLEEALQGISESNMGTKKQYSNVKVTQTYRVRKPKTAYEPPRMEEYEPPKPLKERIAAVFAKLKEAVAKIESKTATPEQKDAAPATKVPWYVKTEQWLNNLKGKDDSGSNT